MQNIFMFLGVILALLGLVLLILGQQQRKRAEAVISWPETAGEVLRSEIREQEMTGGEDESAPTTMYEPVVEYRYTVDGQEYISRQYRLGTTGVLVGLGQAQKILSRYPSNSTATVHYNPLQPDQAVLEPGSASSGVLAAAGGIFLAVGLIFVVLDIVLG